MVLQQLVNHSITIVFLDNQSTTSEKNIRAGGFNPSSQVGLNPDKSRLNGHLAGKLVAIKLPNHERSGDILNHPVLAVFTISPQKLEMVGLFSNLPQLHPKRVRENSVRKNKLLVTAGVGTDQIRTRFVSNQPSRDT